MDEQNDSKLKSWEKTLKENFEVMKKNAEILDQRYKECNENGHKEFIDGYCSHCYRREHYTTPRTDEEYEARDRLLRPLGPLHQPMDAPIRIEKGRREIASQKLDDRFYGLRKIAEQRVIQEAKENTDSIDNKLSE